MHLQNPLVEIAERLPGNGAVSLGRELTAAAARPMGYRNGPLRSRRGFKIDLHDFAGGIAAHHHMKEHRVFER